MGKTFLLFCSGFPFFISLSLLQFVVALFFLVMYHFILMNFLVIIPGTIPPLLGTFQSTKRCFCSGLLCGSFKMSDCSTAGTGPLFPPLVKRMIGNSGLGGSNIDCQTGYRYIETLL